MKKTTLIVGIILIVICVLGIRSVIKNQSNDDSLKENVNYNEITDEVSGENEYIIYNEDTGEQITTVKDESQIQMYIDNPDYKEEPVEEVDLLTLPTMEELINE